MNTIPAACRLLSSRLGAAILIPAACFSAACSPLCTAVDAWTWGTCHANIHAGASAASVARNPDAPEFAAAADQARSRVRALMREQNLPGVSVAIGVDGELVWAEGAGWADIAARQPVDTASLFRIGALAEPMTAVAVGRLIESGQLDIDRPVQDYVPTFPEKNWPLTTRQLMGHVAGMPPLGVEEMLYLRNACSSPLDAVRTYADAPLLFEPGTAFRQSADGWKLVGAVVETAAGEPFLEFMRREVFGPIGMDATVRDEPGRRVPGTVFFYWPFANLDTRTGVEHAADPDNSCQLGAAGLLSTPADLVRFGIAMLRGELLAAGTHAMLRRPLVLTTGASTGHGLGWEVRQIPIGPGGDAVPALARAGRSAGGTSYLLAVPGPDVVVALSTNVSYARGLPGLARALAELFAAAAP